MGSLKFRIRTWARGAARALSYYHQTQANKWEARFLSLLDADIRANTANRLTILRIAGAAARAEHECFAELARAGKYQIHVKFQGHLSVGAIGTALTLQGIEALTRASLPDYTIDAIINTSLAMALDPDNTRGYEPSGGKPDAE
jgi:hypothetical protein